MFGGNQFLFTAVNIKVAGQVTPRKKMTKKKKKLKGAKTHFVTVFCILVANKWRLKFSEDLHSYKRIMSKEAP